MHVVVTGAAGMVGHKLIARLVAAGIFDEVVRIIPVCVWKIFNFVKL